VNPAEPFEIVHVNEHEHEHVNVHVNVFWTRAALA
jgi:hypothetical protein